MKYSFPPPSKLSAKAQEHFDKQQKRNAEAAKHRKLYTEKDLIDFANAVLEKRSKELTLGGVTDADVQNFKTSI